MRIHSIVVNVNYSEYFARGVDLWRGGLETMIMVTDLRDEIAAELALSKGCVLHRTDVFYHDGAYFSKGAAMEEARSILPKDGWHLFLDADVIPPHDWLSLLDAQDAKPGMLHGARRVHEDGRPLPDPELAGFFQLFHSSDVRASAPLDCDFVHAGNYDSAFMRRWPRHFQRILPIDLVHLGEPRTNWCGKGNEEALRKILEGRKRRSWTRETIKGLRK